MDKPAFPVPHVTHMSGDNEPVYFQGMTLREYAAVAAMQGLLAVDGDGGYFKADGTQCKNIEEVQEVVAQLSVGYANALIAKLEEGV